MARIEALLAEYWPHFFFALSLVLGTAAAVHAAMTKHDVRAAIAWVGVVVFSPMFGPLLYFIAGVNRVRRERRSHRRDDAEVSYFVPGGSPRELDVKPVAGPQFASLKILGDKVSVFPLTGGNAMAFLDTRLVQVDAGSPTLPSRTNANVVCCVTEGHGESRIGEHVVAWGPRDIFTIPQHQWVTHRSLDGDARLFMVSDGDVLRRLGLLTEETRTQSA